MKSFYLKRFALYGILCLLVLVFITLVWNINVATIKM